MAKERLSLPLARALRSTLAASPWFMPHCRQSGLLCSSAHLLISRLQASVLHSLLLILSTKNLEQPNKAY